MTQDVDAAAVGHIDIEDDEVPVTLAQFLQGLRSRSRLPNFVDGPILLQIVSEAGPDHRMIIGNENAWHSASRFALVRCSEKPYGRRDSTPSRQARAYAIRLTDCRSSLTKSYAHRTRRVARTSQLPGPCACHSAARAAIARNTDAEARPLDGR